jgi:hypothetical protein
MPKLIGDVKFTGKLGDLSFYKRYDSDEIFVRHKGGPSAHKIKTSDKFEMSRKHQDDFTWRANAISYINRLTSPHRSQKDSTFRSKLQTPLTAIQKLDTSSLLGFRNIYFSRGPKLLEGFSLNRLVLFESIIRNPIPCTVSKDEGKVLLAIPELVPRTNLFIPANYAAYSFVLSVGVLPDFAYNGHRCVPAIDPGKIPAPVDQQTPWVSCRQAVPSQKIVLQLSSVPKDDVFCIMVVIGIRFGTLGATGVMQQVKRGGTGKILCIE